MSLRHAWTVLCDRVITDSETNNVSLDVVEEMSLGASAPLPRVPLAPIDLTLVSLWYGDDSGGVAVVRATLIGPESKKSIPFEFQIQLNNKRIRTMTKIPTIPLNGNGNYFFVVELQEQDRWNEVARIPLEVEIVMIPLPISP